MRPNSVSRTTLKRASVALMFVGALSLLASPLATAQGSVNPSERLSTSRTNVDATPSCPVGFELTEDESTCLDFPVTITTQEPVSCEVGYLSPSGSACFADVVYISQAPIEVIETIDANVQEHEPFVTCPFGSNTDPALDVCVSTTPELNAPGLQPGDPYCADGSPVQAGDVCLVPGSTVVPGTYVPGSASVPPGQASCPTGTDANVVVDGLCRVTGAPPLPAPCLGSEIEAKAFFPDGSFNIVCYAAQPMIPGEPAVAAVAATCEGTPTTQPASACVVVTEVDTAVPANSWNDAAGCGPGLVLVGDDGACFAIVAPMIIPNPPTITCAFGYDGPDSNNQCSRTILTAQPDAPVCAPEIGALFELGDDEFVCLLDNAPTAPPPDVSPSCPKGDYDPKLDLCVLAPTFEATDKLPIPPPTVAPLPVDPPPMVPITDAVPLIVTATGNELDAPPTWVFVFESNCLDGLVYVNVLTAETFASSAQVEVPIDTTAADGAPCTYTIMHQPYLDWETSLPAGGYSFTPLETGVPLLFIGVFQPDASVAIPDPGVTPEPHQPTPATPPPGIPTPVPTPTGAVPPTPTAVPTTLPVLVAVEATPTVAVPGVLVPAVTSVGSPSSTAPLAVGSVNFGGSRPLTPASMLGAVGHTAPAATGHETDAIAATPLAHTGGEASYLTIFGLMLVSLGAAMLTLSRRQAYIDPFD